jgi:hypothetical protein
MTLNCRSSTCAYLIARGSVGGDGPERISNRHFSWNDNFWSKKPYFTSMQNITIKDNTAGNGVGMVWYGFCLRLDSKAVTKGLGITFSITAIMKYWTKRLQIIDLM